jgi:hypothetical protein
VAAIEVSGLKTSIKPSPSRTGFGLMFPLGRGRTILRRVEPDPPQAELLLHGELNGSGYTNMIGHGNSRWFFSPKWPTLQFSFCL